MEYWIPKKKTLAFSLGVVASCLVVYLVSLYIVNAKIAEIGLAYSEAESAVAKEENDRAIARVVDQNSTKIQALRDFFVAPGDEVGFIEKIEEVAKSSGIIFEIVSLSQDKTSESSIKEDITVKIAVEGSWQAIMTFVKELEVMTFGITITNINIDASDDRGWSGFVEATVFREKSK